MRIRKTVQLQTVLAMYDQQIDRKQALRSYQRLKTTARQHIDQTIRTGNFRSRKERIEAGESVISQKGKNVSVERRMVSVESNWTVFKMRDRGQRARSSSLAPNAQTQIDGRKPSKGTEPRKKTFPEGKGKKRAKITSKELVRFRRVIIGILPYVKITKLNRVMQIRRQVSFEAH